MTTRLPADGYPGFVLMDDADARQFVGQKIRIHQDGYVSLKRNRNLMLARMILQATKSQVVAYRGPKHDLRRSNIYLSSFAALRRQQASDRRMQSLSGFVGVRIVQRGHKQVFRVEMRKVLTVAPGIRRIKRIYIHHYYDVFEAGYAYNRLTVLVQGARSHVNKIPDAEVQRIRAKWGGDIPPGYTGKGVTQDVVEGS